MRKGIWFYFVLFIILGKTEGLAQTQEATPTTKNLRSVEQDQTKKPAYSYIKFEVSGLQTQAYGFDMKSWSYGLELEENFSSNKPIGILSGFGLGYRREASQLISRGHYINGKVYRDIPFFLGIGPRIAMGYEWGFPSYDFDRSLFHYENGELEEYQTVYLIRNSNIPTVEATRDAVGNLFGEASISKRIRILTFESGIRVTRMVFGYEQYKLQSSNVIFYNSDQKILIVPSYFIRIGMRIP